MIFYRTLMKLNFIYNLKVYAVSHCKNDAKLGIFLNICSIFAQKLKSKQNYIV